MYLIIDLFDIRPSCFTFAVLMIIFFFVFIFVFVFSLQEEFALCKNVDDPKRNRPKENSPKGERGSENFIEV